MSIRMALWVTLVLSSLHGPLPTVSTTQEREDERRFAVRWGVLPDQGESQGAFRSRLSLQNQGTIPLDGDGWALYFNSPQTIVLGSFPPAVRATRVNGDFYR